MKFTESQKICLMFHDVKIRPKRWNLTPQEFTSIINTLQPYYNDIIITVDDGGIGNYSYIYPILEHFGMKGIFFIPTHFINTPENTRPSYMNEAQIREISRAGHIIGSHSHSHPRNISLLSKDKVLEEWQLSKTILENITGNTVTTCSIPGGFYNPAHLVLLKQLGYCQIFNSTPQYRIMETDGLLIMGRFSIEKNTTTADVLSLVARNRTIQSYLYARHWVSRNIHTFLHRFKI
jgi:peptidoglycan/xylan/chitin deacetylase (PgdA/CDA1 family)